MHRAYYECVFVALGTLHAMRMRRTDICGVPGIYSIFPHYLINGMSFEKNKVTKHKMCVLIFSKTFVETF